ncbi:MAG: DnaJ domain-containing protein [Spirochaetaceae bacterium]|jgi:hypothetical protein|nr:DnaJ domain-containing protein [Spirochaetaceae bacterium]
MLNVSTVQSPPEVEKALQILFGEDFNFHQGTLHYLQSAGIKKAFRSRALLCHPDMLRQGNNTSHLEFQELQDAYNLLMDLKSGQITKLSHGSSTAYSTPPTAHRENPSWTARTPNDGAGDFYYRSNKLPHFILRLGEFLYYSGKISWRTLIDAIVSQRKSNNRLFGQYFIKKGLLNHGDLMFYLKELRLHNRKHSK